jgi:hypothetical protein
MNKYKDFLISASLVFLILLALFALDDSYEDAMLSAQVLDQLIAQGNSKERS